VTPVTTDRVSTGVTADGAATVTLVNVCHTTAHPGTLKSLLHHQAPFSVAFYRMVLTL